MLKTSLIGLFVILQLLVNTADGDEVGGSNDKTRILSISSIFKESNGAGYLIFGARKAFKYLQYAFT